VLNRREFCRQMAIVSGAAVLAPLLSRCAPEADPAESGQRPTTEPPTATSTPYPTWPAQPTQTPTATAELTAPPPQPTEIPREEASLTPAAATAVATVVLVKTADRAWGVRRAIELLNLNPVRGNRVLLKPNFNSADGAPASTHPDILRALVTEIYDLGARAITIAERSGMGDTRAVLQETGVFDLAGEFGLETVILDELEEEAWVIQRSGEFHWSSGFAAPRILLDSECVVQTCNLKTHRYGGHFTMSLKNSVGLVAQRVRPGGYNYMSELHDSPYQRPMIAEINTTYTPALIVMDGVEAFVDGGPAVGKKISPGVVIAGTDRVAVDAVGVAILRMFGTTPQVSRGRIFEQEQIARAAELGLGVDSPERIRIVTGDAESENYAGQISPYLT
jgi:uncharacterized protein (DUF362 family)